LAGAVKQKKVNLLTVYLVTELHSKTKFHQQHHKKYCSRAFF